MIFNRYLKVNISVAVVHFEAVANFESAVYFGQCDQIWRNFALWGKNQIFRHFLRVYFVFGNILNLL